MPVVPFPVKTKGADDVASYVLSLVVQSRQILSQKKQEWFDGIAFVRGDQWTYWDPSTRRLRRRPALPWRVRITDNQTLPLVQAMQALLTERKPTFRAMARTEEEPDVLAAMGFEALMTYQWDRMEMTDKMADAIHSCLVMGSGFWKITWNPMAGTPVCVPMPPGTGLPGGRDAPTAEEEGEEEMPLPGFAEETIFTGDVDVQVVSPFNIHVDPTCRALEEARWVCEESFVNQSLLVEQFGEKAKSINPDVTPDEFFNYEQHLRFDSGTSTVMSDDSKDRVRVLEFWEAPSAEHENGRVITVAGGMTLDVRENPYGGRYPFVHFPAIKIHGRFWPDGVVKHLRPLQVAHNRALSRYIEIMNLMGSPKWIVDKGSGIKETAINDSPGEVIFKAPGSEVVPVPAAPPPTIHTAVMGLATNHMQTISGINDPLAGQNPPNVRSGRSIAYLQEAGMRRFVPVSLQTEKAVRQAGRLLLYLCQRFYREERTIRILGDDARPEVYYMGQADVSRVADVTVVHGSLIPKSRAAQQDAALELLQMAPMLFLDENGKFMRDRLFRMLDMPASTGRITANRADRNHAYQEHIDAKMGEPVQAMPWEDHALHMQTHRAWLQSQDARNNPEAMMAIAANYAEHEMMLQGGMGPPQVAPETAYPQGPEGAAPGGGPPRPPAGEAPPPRSDFEGGPT